MRIAKPVERIEDILTIVLLGLAVALPVADSLFDIDPTPPPLLNRRLAPLPDVSLSRLNQIPKEFEAFFDDRIGFRDYLIRSKSALSIFALGTSPSANILFGGDGWLFLGGGIFGQEGKAIEDFSGRHPFTREQLRSWQASLEKRQETLRQHGVAFVFAIAPNKATIYPEHLPRGLAEQRGQSRLDQLIAWLDAHSSFQVIDLRPALSAAKTEGRLYEKTGSHWNERGGFAADAVLARRLSRQFPAVRPLAPADYEPVAEDAPARELAKMVGVADLMREEQWKMVPRSGTSARRVPAGFEPVRKLYAPPFATEREPRTLPRAVIFHDSFYKAVQPFLSEHFSRAAYYWQYDISLAAVKAERADVVIQVVSERTLLHNLMQ